MGTSIKLQDPVTKEDLYPLTSVDNIYSSDNTPLGAILNNKADKNGANIEKENFRTNLGLGNITKQYYTVSFKTTSITTLDISTFIPDWQEGAVYLLYGYASPVGKTYMSVRAYSDVMTSEQNLSYNGGVQEMGNAFVFEVSRYFYYKASVASNYNSSISFYAYRRVQ